jgi:hypothetical protein
MALDIVVPGLWSPVEALPPGTASIGKNGTAVFHTADLARAEIEHYVVLLCDLDPMHPLIGLRPARNEDERKRLSVAVTGMSGGKAAAQRKRVRIVQALKKLGIEIRKAVRVELVIKDNGLILLPMKAVIDAQANGDAETETHDKDTRPAVSFEKPGVPRPVGAYAIGSARPRFEARPSGG